MHKFLPFLFLFAGTLALPVAAQANAFVGAWQQIESNAGPCPQCQIAIGSAGNFLNVVANNGWSAQVGVDSDRVIATGNGVWLPSTSGSMAGRSFDVSIRIVDQRLYMTMNVVTSDGSHRVVRAVYARQWLGA